MRRRHQLDDQARLAVTPRSKDDAFIGPLHAGGQARSRSGEAGFNHI
jgi:hypothetical protein